MSCNYKFRLADPKKDNKSILDMEAQVTMPGPDGLMLSFQHKPYYFKAAMTGNKETQTILCIDKAKNEIVGIGARCIRDAYVDGKKQQIGYLANLRGTDRLRGSTLLFRGYEYLHKLHGDGKAVFYTTCILEDNKTAQRILTSGLPGLPVYEEYGKLQTFLIPIYGCFSKPLTSPVTKANPEDMHKLAEFINEQNALFNFSPCYTINEIRHKNLFIYKHNGKIMGVAGVWDQSSYKQTVIASIEPMTFKVKFPGVLKSIYLSFTAVKDDDPLIFTALLDKIKSDWSSKGFMYLNAGFDSRRINLTRVLKLAAEKLLESRLYLVYWKNESPELPKKESLFHLETATL